MNLSEYFTINIKIPFLSRKRVKIMKAVLKLILLFSFNKLEINYVIFKKYDRSLCNF